MNEPLVSVIMALHNEEKYVRESVLSILDQTYQELELIIVDDYSTDKSVEICKSFEDPRIRIYSKRDEPRNAASARNIAINMSRGEYLIVQDADDYSYPTRIEKQLGNALENPGRRIVGCWINREVNGVNHIWMLPEKHADIIKGFKRSFNRVTFVAGTMLAPKKVLQEFLYRLQFYYQHDWDLLLRMYESGEVEFYNCQEVLYTYFIRAKGTKWKQDWLDYNIYVRNCKRRRGRGLKEFDTLGAFLEYLDAHCMQKCKWVFLRYLIKLKRQMTRRGR